jgi:hypothetical protein
VISNVAIKFQALKKLIEQDLIKIARFIEGNVSTTGLTGPEKLLMILCLEPVYEMANLQKTDSLLHKIIKGEKLATDQATGTVTIEGSVYSMDSPAVRAKVMYT